ncbi:hypothetical protein [Embleya hyalina]|uniref:SH3b domain-containing protein n=1 Tax=Embleya hyalina TaxID=516124 RepID=A0A401YJG0_9ACTN|nr:hypothetical protein [Embleya hyalina]GCD94762.1 hypothetical protein EHYA_02431 [Embleya hyalina]
MNTSSRALAAGLVAAAALTGSAAAAPAPDAGTTVVVTGDDRQVAADDVAVRHDPSEHSAAVEIVHRGDVLTVRHTSTTDPATTDDASHAWLAVGDRRTGAHGLVRPTDLPPTPPRPAHAAPGPTAAAAEPSGPRVEHGPEVAPVDPGTPRAEGTPMLTTP